MKIQLPYFLLLFFFFLFAFFKSEASSSIDSLKRVLQSSVGEHRARCLNDIALQYAAFDSQTALEYVEEAKKTAIRSVAQIEEIRSMMIYGLIFFHKQKYEEAFSFYEKAFEMSKKIKDNDFLAGDILNELGKVALQKGDYGNAVRYFNASLEKRKKASADTEVGMSMINVGVAYKNWSKYDSALYFLNSAKEWFAKINSSAGKAQSISYIGSTYFLMRDYDKALSFYFESLDLLDSTMHALQRSKTFTSIGTVYDNLSDYSNAIHYYEKSLNLKRVVADSADVAFTLNVIGNTYLKMNAFSNALDYYKKALQLRLHFGGSEDIAGSYNNIGNVYKQLKKPDSASYYYSYALKLRKANGNKVKIAESYNYLGNANWEAKDFNKALEYYMLALDLRKQLDNTVDVAKSLNNIGLIYKDLRSFEKALAFYNEALDVYRGLGDELLMSSQLNNIGGVYWEMEEFGKALSYYGRALEMRKQLGDKRAVASTVKNIAVVLKDIKDYTASDEKFIEALALYKEVKDSLNYAWTLNYYGNLFRDKGSATLAMQKYHESYRLMRSFDNADGIANVAKNIGESLLLEKKYYEALEYLKIAVLHAEKTVDVELQMNAYLVLSQVYGGVGDFKNAYGNFTRYAEVYNQYINTESLKKFSEIQLKYEMAKNEEKLKLIEAENELVLVKEQRFRLFLIFMLAFLFVFVLFMYFRYRIKAHAQALLQIKNNELENALSLLKRSEAEIKHSNQTKDKLFSLVAHDLKNPISNVVSMVKLLDDRWDVIDDDKKKEYITVLYTSSNRAYALLENLLTWARSQSSGFNLKSVAVTVKKVVDDNFRLMEAVAHKKGVQLLFEGDDSLLCYGDAHMIDAVLRNIISNSLKFTNKGYVKVILEKSGINAIVVIEDTGIGIDEKDLQKFFKPDVDYNTIGDSEHKGTGFGLTLVKEFIDINKGTIFVESEVGKGTRFIISLPLP